MPAPQRRASWKRCSCPARTYGRLPNTARHSTRCSRRWSRRPPPSRGRNSMRAIRETWLGLLKSWTRTTAFISKEVLEVVRRPGALFSLIFGPFLIMGAFGLGYSGQSRPLNAVLVLPANWSLPRDASYYPQYVG